MPTTTTPTRRDDTRLTPAQLIRRERQPLPAHDLDGVNYKAWALAVCSAEVKHRGSDFWRAAYKLNLQAYFDKYNWPTCEEVGQFKHEAYAGFALDALITLQVHDGTRYDLYRLPRWNAESREFKRKWLLQRRDILRAFLREVARYKAARLTLAAETAVVVTTVQPDVREAA